MSFFSRAFGTKAETLEHLGKFGGFFSIPDFYYFTAERWRSEPDEVIKEILEKFNDDAPLAIRSSAKVEDGGEASMAGAFDSFLNIKSSDRAALEHSINSVFDTYDGDPENQVLVQKMITDVSVSGVIMTHNLDDGSPYYIINYDDETGQTDSVTGGKGVQKTVYIHRSAAEDHLDSERLRMMLHLARVLESFYGTVPVDIEFCIDNEQRVYLLQVRRIATTKKWQPEIEMMVNRRLPYIADYVEVLSLPRAGLLGNRTILGNMPDWNPAEIIGATPKPLAASLYREIITKSIWSEARVDMGYRPMPAEELMVRLVGRPYIDIRCSLNSFLPAGISDEIGTKVVNAALDRLEANPAFHDKLEFEVAHTILDFTFDEVYPERYAGVLDEKELASFRECLRVLTNNCLKLDETGTLYQSEKTVEVLHKRQKNWKYGVDETPVSLLSFVREKLNECKTMGTLPFSIMARHGFIAETLLRSAIAKGAISKERVHAFKKSIKTIAGDFTIDMRAVCEGKLSKKDFMKKYGHLRSGTYDITSLSYAMRNDLFDGCSMPENAEAEDFKLTNEERKNINALLEKAGLDAVDADGLLEYADRAIVGREYGKFIFTRNLSEAIEGIARWGEMHSLSREDLSFIRLSSLLSLMIAPPMKDIEQYCRTLAEQGKHDRKAMQAVKLSYIIRKVDDIYIVPIHRSSANFITNKKTEGRIFHLAGGQEASDEMKDAIVCIENADPGFDWIFTKGIKGLITKYGGANSHMAIRCAEFALPAAIGCGEQMFGQVSKAGNIELDCSGNTIRVIN